MKPKFELIEREDGRFQASGRCDGVEVKDVGFSASDALGTVVMKLALIGVLDLDADNSRARPKMFATGNATVN